MRFGFKEKNHKHKIYLWYTKSTSSTGKNLANDLGVDCGSKIPPRSSDIVICWGSRLKSETLNLGYLRQKILINEPQAIKNNRDKVLSLKIMNEKKVSVPKFCYDNEVITKLENGEIEFPLIARTRFHQGGSGFELCLCKRDIRRARNHNVKDYYIQYIPNNKEYRVHIFDNKIIRVQIKKGLKDCDNCKRNHDNGWVFSTIPTESAPKNILQEALNSIDAMGMNFGAVDLILSDFNKSFVLEINSAPGLEDDGLEIYSSAVKRYLIRKGITYNGR